MDGRRLCGGFRCRAAAGRNGGSAVIGNATLDPNQGGAFALMSQRETSAGSFPEWHALRLGRDAAPPNLAP
jgi:hypothetical protein